MVLMGDSWESQKYCVSLRQNKPSHGRRKASHMKQFDIQNITHIYFVGIGGIGMSALARFFHAKGFGVAGYDRTESALTRSLQSEGIAVNYADEAAAIPEAFRNTMHTLVVRTPAVPQDLPQYQYFVQAGFTIQKRAEVLGLITKQMRALCVAGTHGKTTTSTILAHLLYQSEIGCNAFLGGISNNYKTNLLLNTEHRTQNAEYKTQNTEQSADAVTNHADKELVVIEADEFDRSFHHLRPYMSVITSVDPDHLDIYGTEEAYRESFAHYTSLVQTGGALVVKKEVRDAGCVVRNAEGVRVYTYSGTDSEADFYAANIVIANGEIRFDFHTPSGVITDMKLGVPVYINIENSVAAMAIAWLNGVTAHELRLGLASYAGIYRRFNISAPSTSPIKGENSLQTQGCVVVDDYAHHPTELEASIGSIRKLYPERKLTGVFQPHLYSRTRDFADGFARALSTLDEVILLPIYPARELPIAGVSSQMLLDKITCAEKRIVEKSELLDCLRGRTHEVIMTLGAGDIDRLVPEIVHLFN